MKTLFTLIIFTLFTIVNGQTTSNRYFEDFSVNNELGWSFLASNANITAQNGELKLTTFEDDFIYILPPIAAAKDDFTFKIKSGSVSDGIEGGGFGRIGFRSLIAIIISDYTFGDSVVVVYTNDIQSYDTPNFILLGGIPMPNEINSLQLNVTNSGNNILVSALVNDVSIYNGQITNADPGLFYGNFVMFIDPDDNPGITQWAIDEIDIHYNPHIQSTSSFVDDFNNIHSPWFRFGDFDHVASSITISNGRLNFNYSGGGTSSAFYVIPPIGSVKDFVIEVEGGAGSNHEVPFSISRFFDYRNYVTMYFEDDTIYFGKAINSFEPDFFANTHVSFTNISKVKFSVTGNAPNLTFTAWINDIQVLTSTINNATQRTAVGSIGVGYEGEGVVNAYFERITINYTQYITEVKNEIETQLDNFTLFQNYPNPFNPSTTFQFNIPYGEHVSLIIYDILGNEIATLVNEYKNAGNHSVTFDASKLPSGVYFYRINVNDFVSTKKLVVLK